MAEYKLTESEATGWWHWECKDSDKGGSAKSKSDAKDDAQDACGEGNGVITSRPRIDTELIDGHVASFKALDLVGYKKSWSVADIPENEFFWLAGVTEFFHPDKSTKLSRVTTILKVWDIYRGGANEESIKEKHNLDNQKFNKLAAKDWYGLKITIDEDGEIHWDFPND